MKLEEDKAKLLGSLLLFTRVFYKIRTGREFRLSYPEGRESHYLTICKALTRVLRGKTKRLCIQVPPRYGKAIDVDEFIFTDKGFKKAHEIKINDKMLGSNGWTKVIGIYPQGILSSKKVNFNDGSSVICNDEHLWSIKDRYTDSFKTKTTLDIEKNINEKDGRKKWRIPIINGNYGEKIPFIDPYLFGCWLGDGHSYYAAITSMDEEIIDSFKKDGHTLKLHRHQSAGKAKTYGIINNGFQKKLREKNLLKNKHIPQEVYLWSYSDRISIFQGLMDTDGTCGKNGQISFTNKNERIIEGISYLINSLGGTYRIYERKCGTKTLNLRLPKNIHPFRLERKQKYVYCTNKNHPRRLISSIEDIEKKEMVCFKVDAEDSLFAVGKNLVLTHNTELIISFCSWALAHHPDSNFIYLSYSHSLAKKQTQTVRQIVSLMEYKELFGVNISVESSAKDNFETTQSGSVYAAGAGGTITGRGAGIQGVKRFGGAIIIDDIHKPSEVTSDVMRQSVNDWYLNTLQSRVNDPSTPIVFIGQSLHEDDLPSNLKKGYDGYDWETVILPALDMDNNALFPEMHTKQQLLIMKDKMPYEFSAQYQQNPQPAGGGIFKPEWFVLLDDEPEILSTFITADTAETDKTYNDATVFSFWGLYKINDFGIDSEIYALHWIDCWQLWCEPKDLLDNFTQFYTECMRHSVKPKMVAIEKKSTGTTLLSLLSDFRGLNVVDIERNRTSGSKTQRFLETQTFVAQKLISLPKNSKHTSMCIDHMQKITANDTHRYDDIADTFADAVKMALRDKIIVSSISNKNNSSDILNRLALNNQRTQTARSNLYGHNRSIIQG